MDLRCVSFPPVAGPGCRVLVLGSMPGVASLAAEQYYAHPRNAFWPILYSLWEAGPPGDYRERLAFAMSHRVAIWDVIRCCRREGSADASIRDAVPNDFGAFFSEYRQVHTVFFNGRYAQSLFLREAAGAAGNRRMVLLPSTSPAYTLSVDAKLAAWRVLRTAAEQEHMEWI